jgi:hypothetical protein
MNPGTYSWTLGEIEGSGGKWKEVGGQVPGIGYLVSAVRRRFGGDRSVVSHLRLVDDELTLAFAEVLHLDAVVGDDEVAVDVELDRGGRIFDLFVDKIGRF